MPVLWIILMLCLPGAAMAQTADEVRALQFALSHVPRYAPGPVDGIVGPRTRGAVDAFADTRPLEPAFWVVAADVERLVWWRRPWTEEVETAVRDGLAASVRSGPVPTLQDKRFFAVDRGAAACVEVGRGANARWLHFSLRPVLRMQPKGGPAEPGWAAGLPAGVPKRTAALWCRLGYAPAPP